MELLLLSNSTLPGKAWLEHALPLIAGQVKAAVRRYSSPSLA
ncbi:alpha-aspartyl dipeptidase Peptidase E [Klebsiella pneumoniae]|uniref:Alpha-aspartyl dipeptidase Peptidase E n=1 Tax=Klebsiella pneumoniae TaxID=573 RepID=A0A377TMQ9_KLEPN|nr:alpha-aspartyl dipeptidase Peptidase E [Klebsiella pneumoniae]